MTNKAYIVLLYLIFMNEKFKIGKGACKYYISMLGGVGWG